MTISPSEEHNKIAETLDPDLDTGLEEFSISDAQVPRISIRHQDGLFRESLTDSEFPEFKAIMFGLVKQRILWHHVVDNDAVPMCKSPDFQTGFPLVNEDVPVSRQFPWQMSGFDINSYPADENGLRKLPCEQCALKKWGTHPTQEGPYCNEQWTTPLMLEQEGFYIPAFISFQKTALKSLQAYFTWFQARKGAPYQYFTKVSLIQASKAGNTYSIPKFTRLDPTEAKNWREYSTQLGIMREYLKRHPDESERVSAFVEPTDNSWDPVPPTQTAPATQTAPPTQEVQNTQTAPVTQTAPEPVTVPAAPTEQPTQGEDPNDLPF